MIGYLRRVSEERRRRAQRRRRTEEIMAWICVPVILFVGWTGWKAWDEMGPGRPPATAERPPPTTTGVVRR